MANGIEGLELFVQIFFVLIFLNIIQFGYHTVMWLLTPKPAKKIKNASLFHKTLALIFRDDNKADLVTCKVHPEGFIETDEKEPRYFFVPRPTFNIPVSDAQLRENIDVKDMTPEEADAVKEAQEIYDQNKNVTQLEKEALKVTMFEGCKTPLLIGYDGVAIITNVSTTVGLANEEKQVKYKLLEKIVVDAKGKEKVKNVMAKVLLPFDPKIVRKFFSKLWDQSVIRSYGRKREEIGYKRALRGRGDQKMFIIAMIIIGALIIGGAIVIKVIGG